MLIGVLSNIKWQRENLGWEARSFASAEEKKVFQVFGKHGLAEE